MLHDITNKKQGIYTKFSFSRLALSTHFAMHCQECRLNSGDQPRFVATERIRHMNYQPRGISDRSLQGPASYQSEIEAAQALLKTKDTWNGVSAEAGAAAGP